MRNNILNVYMDINDLVSFRDELEIEITSMSISIDKKKDIVSKLNSILEKTCKHVWIREDVESTNEYGEVDTFFICEICSIVKK